MTFSSESKLTLPVGKRDHGQGVPGAAIVLVEYGDYECPNCVVAHRVVKEVQRSLGEQIFFVFRNFPFSSSHPHAQIAAEAAEAGAAQGKFWELHDAIFERSEPLTRSLLPRLASQIGLDVGVLESELADGTHQARVREDVMSGVRSGVNGTPTFFVNGARYDGFADFDALMTSLESVLL